jgi:membrane dipeptidase
MIESSRLPLSRAQSILRSSIVWDNHACLPMRADSTFIPQIERYRRAGVTVLSLNVGFADMSLLEHMRVLSFMRQWVANHSDRFRLISTVEEVRSCKAEGKLGIVFDIEGMVPVQSEPSFVQTFYELGVRWMLIAYNRNNAAGGGCLDEDTGLTEVGRRVIDEMERVGMVVCLSHASARTVADALEYGKRPMIFSHSNPYGDSPHPRNISDELMRTCARKGGVVGLSGIGLFLGTNQGLVPRLLRQFRYVLDLVGADHVGLGLDYVFDRAELDQDVEQNPQLYPPGLRSNEMQMIDPESIGLIAEGLAHDNLNDSQIQGILGENWLRLAGQVWR